VPRDQLLRPVSLYVPAESRINRSCGPANPSAGWSAALLGEKQVWHYAVQPRRLPGTEVGTMFADETDDIQPSEQRPFDEKLDRESGVFVEPDGRQIACDPEAEACAPDDYVNDPEVREIGVPGTVDDTQLTFGIEVTAPSDEHLVLDGATKPAGASHEKSDAAEDVGQADESELWGEQKVLLDEDEVAGLKLRGFPEEEIPDILEAMGDDAAEPLQDFPNGTSATGDWSAPEHGGFPERED
jgi:hypothetical protein